MDVSKNICNGQCIFFLKEGWQVSSVKTTARWIDVKLGINILIFDIFESGVEYSAESGAKQYFITNCEGRENIGVKSEYG